jgi:serine/threonine protein kinase
MSGQLVGDRFAILRDQSRQGGSSIVYKAIDLQGSGQVPIALKVLSGDGFSPPEVNLFFEREKQALMALQHPNIVQFVDAGQDPQTGDYYLALEWVDTTLREWLGPEPPGFDDFVDTVALPLARALAFAHERSVVHRDVKPSNVLVSADGVPKLADFGISKIKNALTGGPITVAAFGSRPYAAPETEGTASYARDVYGFGALLLACLSNVTLDDYSDIQLALESLDVSPELYSLIERCVDFDPAGRPQNGTILSLELESWQQRRRAKQVVDEMVHLSLTKSAISIVSEATEAAGAEEVQALLEEDLNDVPTFRPQTPAGTSPDSLQGRNFYLAGSLWSVLVTADDKPDAALNQRGGSGAPNSRLNIVHAVQLEAGDADKWRELNFSPSGYRFTFKPPLNHLKLSRHYAPWSLQLMSMNCSVSSSGNSARRTDSSTNGISSSTRERELRAVRRRRSSILLLSIIDAVRSSQSHKYMRVRQSMSIAA